MKIKQTEIVDTVIVCPYCMNENSAGNYRGCCGESSDHFEQAYVLTNDELVLVSEAEVEHA